MNYNDIIEFIYVKSKRHKQMTLDERAAQFMPFAALTGYGDQVKETERYTDYEVFLDEDNKNLLDEKLSFNSCNDKLSLVSSSYIAPSIAPP